MRLAFFVALGLTVLLLVGAYVLPAKAREALARGYIARGEVIRIEERVNSRANRSETFVWARYEPKGGGESLERYHVEVGLHKAWWEQHVPVGTEVDVFVDPEFPEQVWINGAPDPSKTTRQLLTAAAVLGGLTVLLGWSLLRRG